MPRCIEREQDVTRLQSSCNLVSIECSAFGDLLHLTTAKSAQREVGEKETPDAGWGDKRQPLREQGD
jgi:hypothetical protein